MVIVCSAGGFASELRDSILTRYLMRDDRAGLNMANDAFALSPISASGTLPSETDYHAISEAFMETSRGRWFLKEYARRNRNADTAMVLEAVTRIETSLAAQKAQEALQQAPVTPLTDAMEAIRAIIDDAKATAAEAVTRSTGSEALAPSRKGVRIILEVAWRLREIGYDSRICDILEAQAKAIAANHDVLHDVLANPAAHDAVLSAFDLAMRRIGELAADTAHAEPEPTPVQPLAENVVSLKPVVQTASPVRPTLTDPPVGPTASVIPVEAPLAKAPPVVAQAARVAPAPASPAPASSEVVSTDLPADMVTADLISDDLISVDLAATPAAAETTEIDQPVPTAVSETAPPQPTHAPAATAATSLGGALLARGMVAAPGAKTDPLTPFRRMSQAEKIAFFS